MPLTLNTLTWEHLRHLQQLAVDCLLHDRDAALLFKVLGTKSAEVIVRIRVIECENQEYEGLPTASKGRWQSATSL